jgi:hypothetical protein
MLPCILEETYYQTCELIATCFQNPQHCFRLPRFHRARLFDCKRLDPYIAGDLAVSYDQGTYVITSFAVGNGIVLAISGWLSRRFEPKPPCPILLLFCLLACGISRVLKC